MHSYAMGRRLDGALHAAPSRQDHVATPNLSSLPRRVDLRDHCGTVEDQGHIGSCVANAVVGAVEYQHRRSGRAAVELSRMFVYFNGRRLRGTVDSDSGMTTAEGLAAFLAFGAPPEPSWPYDPALFSARPGDDIYAAAREYAPAEYARINGTDNVRAALAQHQPVVFLVSLPSRCYEEAARTGVVPVPTPSEAAGTVRNAGHSMLLVGYDLDAQQFLVRNSWGPSWGDHGYCRMSFEVFETCAEPTSHWIVGRLETSGAFTIHRPSPVARPVEGSVRDKAERMRTDIRSGLTKDLHDSLKGIRDRVDPGRE